MTKRERRYHAYRRSQHIEKRRLDLIAAIERYTRFLERVEVAMLISDSLVETAKNVTDCYNQRNKLLEISEAQNNKL